MAGEMLLRGEFEAVGATNNLRGLAANIKITRRTELLRRNCLVSPSPRASCANEGNNTNAPHYSRSEGIIPHLANFVNIQKRATSLLRSIGFQTPIELNKSGFIGSIPYIGKDVKINGEFSSKY